ncbi:MAG: hypothetical protein AB7U46_13730 [Paenirhodobacter sp.]
MCATRPGNALENWLSGNVNDNRLFGYDGDDVVTGGRWRRQPERRCR